MTCSLRRLDSAPPSRERSQLSPEADRVGTAEGEVSRQLSDCAGPLPDVASGNPPRGLPFLLPERGLHRSLRVSRLTGEDVIAVFDRGTRKLDSSDGGRLMDHPELPEVLERYGIGLVV